MACSRFHLNQSPLRAQLGLLSRLICTMDDLSSFLQVNPKALQSSMDYDQYLRSKLSGTEQAEDEESSSRRQKYKHRTYDRVDSSLHRPSASSLSRMRETEVEEKEDIGEQPVFEPLRHSWRRHVEPPQSSISNFTSTQSSLSRNDREKDKMTSPAQIASLLQVAQDSMSESKKRSEMISRLLAEEEEKDKSFSMKATLPPSSLSPHRRKKLGSKLHIEINSPQRSAEVKRFDYYMGNNSSLESNESTDSVSFSSGRDKARLFNLKRTFTKLTDYTRHSRLSREQREEAAKAIEVKKVLTLKERTLLTWKREVAISHNNKILQRRQLSDTFRKWSDFNQRQALSRVTADRHFELLSAKRMFQAFSGLVNEKRDRLYQRQVEALNTDHAANHRDQTLLTAAFRGIKLASRQSRGEKEIEEESAERRARITKLMKNLNQKGQLDGARGGRKGESSTLQLAKPRGAGASIDERRAKTQSACAITAPRKFSLGSKTTSAQGQERVSKIQNELVTAAGRDGKLRGASASASAWHLHDQRRERQVKGKNVKGASKYGYNDEGKWDDGFGEAEYYSKARDEDKDEDEDDSAPPPAYYSANNRVAGGDTSRVRAVAARSLPAHAKGRIAASNGPRTQTPREVVAAASRRAEASLKQHQDDFKPDKDKEKLSQAQLDQRAHMRRIRITELRRASQNRVFSSRKEKEEMLARRRELEDLEYAQEMEEYYKKQRESKVNVQEKVLREAEMKKKVILASTHRSRALLISHGFGPWRRLVQHRRIEWVKAMDFYDDTLLQSTWIALYGYCMNLRTERARKENRQSSISAAHYKRSLITATFRKWQLHRKLLKAKSIAVTGHFSRFTVHRRAFGAWRVALERERRREVQACRAMKPRGDKAIKRHFWSKWMSIHQDALLDREVNNRVDSQWAKVQSWLN